MANEDMGDAREKGLDEGLQSAKALLRGLPHLISWMKSNMLRIIWGVRLFSGLE